MPCEPVFTAAHFRPIGAAAPVLRLAPYFARTYKSSREKLNCPAVESMTFT